MDDIIYVLLAVLWLAFSIYNANQKKKKQAAAQQKPTPAPVNENPKPRSILEEILLDEEVVHEYEQEFAEPEAAPITVPEYTAANQYREEVIKRTITDFALPTEANNTDSEIQKEIPGEAHPVLGDIRQNFNLRQAVVYSVVLERPFQ